LGLRRDASAYTAYLSSFTCLNNAVSFRHEFSGPLQAANHAHSKFVIFDVVHVSVNENSKLISNRLVYEAANFIL